jgi:Amidohydrolase family
MIASDGILENGKGHPRTAGTYSRVLGNYVREQHVLTLMDALTKMTLMPAQRLERRVPSMKSKGRIRLGADADLTIFDPQSIIDRSTFQEPAKYAEGVKFVLTVDSSQASIPVVPSGHRLTRQQQVPVNAAESLHLKFCIAKFLRYVYRAFATLINPAFGPIRWAETHASVGLS